MKQIFLLLGNKKIWLNSFSIPINIAKPINMNRSQTVTMSMDFNRIFYFKELKNNNYKEVFKEYLIDMINYLREINYDLNNTYFYFDNSDIHQHQNVINLLTDYNIKCIFGVKNYCLFDL